MKSNKVDVSDVLVLVGLLFALVGMYALWGWAVTALVLGVFLMAAGYRMIVVKK